MNGSWKQYAKWKEGRQKELDIVQLVRIWNTIVWLVVIWNEKNMQIYREKK